MLGDGYLADIGGKIVFPNHQVRVLAEHRRLYMTPARLNNGLAISQLNPPTLFGLAHIDVLPDEVVLAAEKRLFSEFSEIHGRARRLSDGRIGRFGWKAGTASLRDMVLRECAEEIGLEVPGYHQVSFPPRADDRGARKLDLTQHECELLLEYVRRIEPAVARKPVPPEAAISVEIARGQELFAACGCVCCHVSKLGEIDGIYSDLLLHSMGRGLAGRGTPSSGLDASARTSEAAVDEWRTPPLWGFRDTAPYRHDGRANDLEDAVAFHGGESVSSTIAFFKLGKLLTDCGFKMFLWITEAA